MPRNGEPRVQVVPARTTNLPAGEMRELQRAGYDAFTDGHSPLACPFRADPTEPGKKADLDRASAWFTGYAAAQTDARIHRTSTPAEVREQFGAPGRF